MPGRDTTDLLDLVYETAIEPALWVPVMERLADMTGGAGGWLSQLSVEDGSGCDDSDPLARVDPSWASRYALEYADRNPLHQLVTAREYRHAWKPTILTDEDLVSRDELVRTAFYNDFWGSQDIGAALMIRLAVRGAEAATLNISRLRRHGQFNRHGIEAAGRLQSHLIRAFELGRRIAANRQLGADLAGVLDRSPHGLFILADNGRLRHANTVAASLASEAGGLRVADGRLTAANSSDARLLEALIAVAGTSDRARRSGGSMAMATPTRTLPLSITVAPMRSERLSYSPFRAGPSILVCVTDVSAGVSLPQQRLRDVFGLTRAEARIALALFEGCTPREAADQIGVSVNTLRNQMMRVFEKTHTHRQSDLIRLMLRVAGETDL